MDVLAYLNQLYDYHYWATHRLLASMVGLSSDQLNEPLGKAWGSLHATLTHTLNAEWIWLQRCQGTSPAAFPDANSTPTVYDIRARWEKQEAAQRAFLAAQTPESVERLVVYQNTHGEEFELPLWQLLAHVINHATHHRAEVAEMLAQLDVAHPEDDLNLFFLERSGQR